MAKKKATKKKTTKKKAATRKKKRNIYEKMFDVQHEVHRILKLGENENQGNFKYVYERDVIAEVKPILKKHKLLLLPIKVINSELTEDHKKVKLDMEITLLNVENIKESYTTPWSMNAADKADKATTKALTMALKFYLLKTFMVETAEPDPDGENGAEEKEKKGSKKQSKPKPQSVDTIKQMISASNNLTGLMEYKEQLAEIKNFTQAEKNQINKALEARISELEK